MFLLLLVYFLTQSSSGETAPISSINIQIRDTSSCNDLNTCRSLLSIIWSCLSTIFLCTWVAIHPNIAFTHEDPDIGSFRKWIWNPLRHFMAYRLPLFLVALLVPEYILAWAIRQYLRAGEIEEKVPGWTRTHGFFMIMGGFQLFELPAGLTSISIPFKSGNPSGFFIPQEPSYKDEVAAYPLRLRDVPLDVLLVITPTEAELKDRGKSDFIAKTIGLVQTLWFVVQCITRGLQHLPITELEVVTLAYAMMNFFIYAFWWNKPRDVGCPIRVYKKATARSVPASADSHMRARTVAEDNDSWATSRKILRHMVGTQDEYTKLSREPKVPMFWSDTANDRNAIEVTAFLGPAILGIGFGAIHCIAWNSEFPSHIESVLWRISCIAMMVVPLVASLACGAAWLNDSFYRLKHSPWLELIGLLSIILLGMTSWLYLVARIATIAMAFTTLRSLPSGAFTVVDWTTFFPHI